MKKTDNMNLIVKKEGFFNKIFNFISTKIFQFKKYKKSKNEVHEIKRIEKKEVSKNLEIDKTWLKLMNIQDELNRKGINEENLKELIKDLSFEEKERLKNMYIEQNARLKQEIENYKRKIIAIKSEF